MVRLPHLPWALLCVSAACGRDKVAGIAGDAAAPTGDTATPTEICGSISWKRDAWPVLEIVLDTDPTMQAEVPGMGVSRWEMIRGALQRAFAVINSPVAVGMTWLPGDGICAPRTIPAAPLTLDTRRALGEALAAIGTPAGGHPNAATMAAAAADARSFTRRQMGSSPVVMVLTSGLPDAPPSCPAPAASPLADLVDEAGLSHEAGIATCVLALPGSAAIQNDLLQVAIRGAGPSPDAVACFQNHDRGDTPGMAVARNINCFLLGGSPGPFGCVFGDTLSCVIRLPAPPLGRRLDVDRGTVMVATPEAAPMLVPRSDPCSDGWAASADGTQITLCGPSCDALKAAMSGPSGAWSAEFPCQD